MALDPQKPQVCDDWGLFVWLAGWPFGGRSMQPGAARLCSAMQPQQGPTAPCSASGLHVPLLPSPPRKQGFYPIQPEATFLPGDQLAMACNFDSSRMVRGGRAQAACVLPIGLALLHARPV